MKKTKKQENKWIQSSIRRPGSLTAAAKRHGKSVLAEAQHEAKSPDKKIASRGRLALRFKGAAKHGNIVKKKHSKKRLSVKA